MPSPWGWFGTAIGAATIWQLKAAELKKSNLLTLHRGTETFAGLGGLDALKDFCVVRCGPSRPTSPRPGNRPGRPARHREIGLRQGIGQRNGPAHADSRSRQPEGSLVGQTESGRGRRCGSSTPWPAVWSLSTRWTTPWPGTVPAATPA